MTKQDDEARKKILARRATFVAAALAGVGTACGKEPTPPPQPCLTPVQTVDDAAAPEPCLSPPPRPDEADAGKPEPCLRVPVPADDGTEAPPPPPPRRDAGKPQPCLKIAPPRPK